MSQNFCTSCGASLTADQKFCTNCGKAICASNPNVSAADTAAFAPGAISLDNTPLQTQPNESAINATVQPKPSPTRSIIVATLCTLLVVAIIVATLFATGVFKTPEPAPEEPNDTLQEQSSVRDEETAEMGDDANMPEEADETPAADTDVETTPIEPQTDHAEVATYDKLLVLYNDLGVFDQRITEAAQRFNENYLSPDYETRLLYATEAEELLDDIYSSYDDLYSTTISSQSPNASAYDALDICYEDCIQRISVISEAWNISLSCEEPSLHRDEILAPIMCDNEDGTNRYYAEFQETYPLAEPIAP